MTGIAPALVDTLRQARRVAALTGAGMSAESGVPTFRDAQTGLWAQYDPQELATPTAFRRNPRLVWEWYMWRRNLVARAQPHTGHSALAIMARRIPQFTLITQNVDGLHQQAGSPDVIELHGNIRRTVCASEGTAVEEWAATEDLPPRCPRCGSLLRPDVVWFGEALPAEALHAALAAARRCDVFLSIGTASVVEPAASLPYIAQQHGARIVEVNPNPTPLTPHADDVLQGPAGSVLPELVAAIWPAT